MLTAAHCVLPGADYKLVAFDARASPSLKDIAQIARHPHFELKSLLAHRATADVALLKLAQPLPAQLSPAQLGNGRRRRKPGDRFVVAGFGVTVRGDGKTGGTLRTAHARRHRPAGHSADPPGRSSHQQRARRPRRLHRRFRRAGLSRHATARLALIGVVSWSTGPEQRRRLRRPHRRHAARALPRWIVETARKLGSPLE